LYLKRLHTFHLMMNEDPTPYIPIQKVKVLLYMKYFI
jgi:hypothetical protein